MAVETWRPIAGYEGIYEVSDMGQVRRMTAHLNTFPGRVLRAAVSGNGYHGVALYRNGRRKSHAVHILVATAFCPRREGAYVVNHIGGDKADNRAEALEWCTPAENSQHAIRIGIWKPRRGDRHPLRKLSFAVAQEMRTRYAAGGVTMKALGIEHGVCMGTVWMLVAGRTWSNPE